MSTPKCAALVRQNASPLVEVLGAEPDEALAEPVSDDGQRPRFSAPVAHVLRRGNLLGFRVVAIGFALSWCSHVPPFHLVPTRFFGEVEHQNFKKVVCLLYIDPPDPGIYIL